MQSTYLLIPKHNLNIDICIWDNDNIIKET